MFNSCSEKKGAGAEVCLVQKRGWLKSNGKHLVRNMELGRIKAGAGSKLKALLVFKAKYPLFISGSS